MDIRIFTAAHKRFEMPAVERIYIPLHAGREGKEDLGYLSDNTGDHISYKNENYCELTGLYWIWKNCSCDAAGLCHYRRYLSHNNQILTRIDIEDRMQHYDLILPDSSMTKNKNEYEHYCEKHQKSDLECCLNVIRERCPQYEVPFRWTLSSNLVSLGNIMIARWEVLDQYCRWLFDILFEIERRIDFSKYDQYQRRVFGFLSERLLRTWVMMQELQVLEEEVYYLE